MLSIDNPESGESFCLGTLISVDIAGANGHGWSSILVKTGVFRGGTPSHTPTKITEDVEEAVTWAIERELSKGR